MQIAIGAGKHEPLAEHPAAVGKPQIRPDPHCASVVQCPPPPSRDPPLPLPPLLPPPLLLPELALPPELVPLLELAPLPELAPPPELAAPPELAPLPDPLLLAPPLLVDPLPPSPPPSATAGRNVDPPQPASAVARVATPISRTFAITHIRACVLADA